MVDPRKIAILGAGRIGEALISGLLSSGWREPGELAATARRAERVAELRERYGVEATLSNRDAAAGAALVVIAVKPQDIDALLGEIGGLILPEQTVLSIAAAIPTAQIETRLTSGVPVVRAMPNTPSTVHEGMAGLCAGAHASDEQLDLAEEALSHLGGVVRVPEASMDAITAVSGSGPAYFALLAEAMIEAGSCWALARDLDAARRADDARDGEAAPRREDAPGGAPRDGDVPRRNDHCGDSRAGDGGCTGRVLERDPGGDGSLARARRRRAVALHRLLELV
jgi:pyrroline-5-carboxylate reductase